MDERYQQLCHRIRDRRAEQGLTQRELAERTGIAHGSIGKVEAAYVRPSINLLTKLGRVLDIEVDELLELAGYPLRSASTPLPAYLRRQYGLPAEATSEVEEYFRRLQEKYGTSGGGTEDGN